MYVCNLILWLGAAWSVRDYGLFKAVREGKRFIAEILVSFIFLKGKFLKSSFFVAAMVIGAFAISVVVQLSISRALSKRSIKAMYERREKEGSNFSKNLLYKLEGDSLEVDYFSGNPGAKVVITEFFDYECPACRKFHVILDKVLQEFSGSILVVYKNFPLDNSCNPLINREFHRWSCWLALVVRCAGEQGLFKEFHNWALTVILPEKGEGKEKLEEKLKSFIKSVGADEEDLLSCVREEREKGKIIKDINLASRLKVFATPTVFINGVKAESLSFNYISKAVKDLLEVESK